MKPKTQVETITRTPRKGRGWLQQRFEGSDYMRALVELLKNCFDWGAMHILLGTSDSNKLVVVDDGVGMNADNQTAFCSISASTAGENQQGRFCTGSKLMLIEHALRVVVRTVSAEDYNTVYQFTLEAATYENVLDAGMGIEVSVLPRNKTNWPYEFASGTELTYHLKRPESKSILRGAQLAKRLSGRLPALVRDFLLVDGSRIPAKKVTGDTYTEVRQLAGIGELHLNLYQPATKGQEDGLFAGAGTIPDVPFRDLATLARQHGFVVPEVFLNLRICGTISSPLFKKYEREDRKGFLPAILDDKGLALFLAYLEEIAPEVEEKLQLVSRKGGNKSSVVGELARLTNEVFNPKGIQPAEAAELQLEAKQKPQVTTARETRVIHLSVTRPEVEVGEQVEISAIIAKAFRSSYDLSKLVWNTDDSLGVAFNDKTKGLLRFRAKRVGRGRVSASLPRTAHSTEIAFTVVPEGQRVFKLQSAATVHAGESLTVYAQNEDKLKGEIVWSYVGNSGELTEDAGNFSAVFAARSEGVVTVYAKDSKSGVKAECQITVLPPRLQRPLLCIDGLYFDVLEQPWDGGLVQMIQGNPGANLHLLYLNSDNQAYREAERAGQLSIVLLQAVCAQFGDFLVHELGAETRVDEGVRSRAAVAGTSVLAKLLSSMDKA